MTETPSREAWERGSIEYFRREWTKQKDDSEHVYPRSNPSTQWDAFELPKAEFVRSLLANAVPAGGRVLEYGCGAAGILIYLANHGYRGVALDASPEALAIARANDRAEADSGRGTDLSFVVANALTMPFPDGSFECVISNGLLEHFAPEVVPELLSEVVRVLGPGGLFIADIVHRRASTRQVAKPINFAVSYLAQIARGRGFGMIKLWRAVSTPMYENAFDRTEWHRALTAAGLEGVTVRSFRWPPPLTLPRRLDRWYGKALLRFRILRWTVAPQPHNMPLGWVYMAVGRKPGEAP
jgi:SAM-dependent methyltransferase